MARFLHTADWHLGMKYAQLGPKADRAREIRMETVERLLKTAKEKNVDFILVAGDTFDSNEVDSNTIRELCTDLSKLPCLFTSFPETTTPNTDSPYNDPLWDEVENVRILKSRTSGNCRKRHPVPMPCEAETVVERPHSMDQSRR